MEKLTDNWLKTAINENRVSFLGVNTLFHNNFEFFVIISPPAPYTPESEWWCITLMETYSTCKTFVRKYKGDKLSIAGTGLPDNEYRVKVSDDELKFWKESKAFHNLIDAVVNRQEKYLNDGRVSYSLSHNHRDFSETRKILDKTMKNVTA